MASARNVRITPDKRRIAVLVYLTACLQVVGYSWKAFSGNGVFAHYLALHNLVSSDGTYWINQVYVGLMIFGLVWAFFRWSPWPFYLIGTLFFIEAIFRTAIGGSMAASLSIPAECALYLWFLAMGYALSSARTLDVEIGLPSVRLLLRLGLALSFITHGVEAILRHPGFIDNALLMTRALIPITEPPSLLSSTLVLIGIIDVTVGLLVLVRPNKKALVCMGVWGAITAFSRMLVAPYPGFFEAIMSAPHFTLPFLIMIIEGQRSIRRPLRHVTTHTLKKMGMSPSHWAWKRSSHEG